MKHPDKAAEQFHTITDDDETADDIDPADDFWAEAIAEDRNQQSHSGKPQAGCTDHAADKWHGLTGCECDMKSAEQHGTVNDRLWIKPCDNTGGRNRFLYGHIFGFLIQIRCFGPEKSDANINHDQTADTKDDQLQPFKFLHDRSDTEKTGERQCDVKKYDNECGQQSPFSCVCQSGIDDKQIL